MEIILAKNKSYNNSKGKEEIANMIKVAFLTLHPLRYAELLEQKLNDYDSSVYLVKISLMEW